MNNNVILPDQVVDIFDAVGLQKPNIGLLDDAFLDEVRNLPERNLAVELLERLLEGEIKTRFASNVIQQKKFRVAARRGDDLGLSDDEIKFYDALTNNEAAVLQQAEALGEEWI